MKSDKLVDLRTRVSEGSLEELRRVLKAYGEIPAQPGWKSPLDMIEEGVDQDQTGEKDKKKSLVLDYLAKEGIFAEAREASPEILQTLREIRDNVADLTRQVQKLQDAAATRDVVKEMRGAIQSSAVTRKAPPLGN